MFYDLRGLQPIFSKISNGRGHVFLAVFHCGVCHHAFCLRRDPSNVRRPLDSFIMLDVCVRGHHVIFQIPYVTYVMLDVQVSLPRVLCVNLVKFCDWKSL